MDAPVAISVIVVFHNAETTIERTLRSLAGQRFDRAEYLFVDDASTDRTAEIIRDFMALNPDLSGRHRLITAPMKRGVACGTSEGIANSRGIYVMRCDADDYLASDALRRLWDASDHGEYDAVFAHYVREKGDRSAEVAFRRIPATLNDMPLDTLHFSMCNKILRRSILADNGIDLYAGVDCWEDLGLVSRFMLTGPKVKYLREPVYHYVAAPRGTTLSTSANDRLLREHLMMALLVEQWFVEHSADSAYEEFLTRLKFIAKVRYLRGRDKDVARWKKTFPEVNSRIMSLRHVRWYWRLLFCAVAIFPTGITQWVADRCDAFYRRPKATPSVVRPDASHPNIPEKRQ